MKFRIGQRVRIIGAEVGSVAAEQGWKKVEPEPVQHLYAIKGGKR